MKVHQISNQNNHLYLSQNINFEVQKAIDLVRDMGLTLGFAESCTGGLLSSEFTKISGVSDIFVGSVVCYSNSVKQSVLGVQPETLKQFGAVSSECAEELARGVLKTLRSTLAIAITGVAGPTGGSTQKPVGTVFISVAGINSVSQQSITKNYEHHFGESLNQKMHREQIQKMASVAALEHLQDLMTGLKKIKS